MWKLASRGVIVLLAMQVYAFDTTFTQVDQFLKRHVCNGGVDYTAAGSDLSLDAIMKAFGSTTTESFSSYSKKVQLAALINLYNIATIKLIVDNKKVSSIKKIDKAWSRKWISFCGKKVSLNQIEHEMIRKDFNEPLIHCALVCAAKSCPALKKGAFTAGKLDAQLFVAANEFVGDDTKNSVSKKELSLSKIFSWYGDDFKARYGGVEQFIKKIRGLEGNYKIIYRDYDWSLNTEKCLK